MNKPMSHTNANEHILCKLQMRTMQEAVKKGKVHDASYVSVFCLGYPQDSSYLIMFAMSQKGKSFKILSITKHVLDQI